MDNLRIPGTERTPSVDFEFTTGRLSLTGESYPENASAVFAPIFAALEAYLPQAKGQEVRFTVSLVYFNSSSAKALMNIFQVMERAAIDGVRITIDWVYAEGDETMLEFGEDFSEDLENVVFNLVSARIAH